MPRRQIKDEHGSAWDVWDVKPGDATGRASYDRRNGGRPDEASDASVEQNRPMLSAELENGWICFQSGSERRRFAPIPPNWTELPDGVLRVMLDVASPVLSPGTPADGTPASPASDTRSASAK